jgi:phosphatidate cytidylyltransferase
VSAITGDSLILRVASGAVLIPIVLAAVILGTPYFQTLVALAAVILGWEWLSLLGLNRSFPDAGLFFAALAAGLGVGILAGPAQGLWVAITAAIVLAIVYSVRGRARPPWLVGGVLYIALPCLSLLWLRLAAANGLHVMLWVLLAVWASDIGAYAAGRTVGGPRLMPAVSPNKTWSGLAGAMISAAAAGVIYVGALGQWAGNLNLYAATGFFGAIVGAIGQFGDMVESRIKRRFNVKDMGALIPGHGGLFDRVDALLFVAPAITLFEIVFHEGIPL